MGGLGLTGWVGATAQLPGNVTWLGGSPDAPTRWLDAGDRLEASGRARLQVGPMALDADGSAGVRGPAQAGPPTVGLVAASHRADPGGIEVSVGAGATIQWTRGFDTGLSVHVPVIGAGAKPWLSEALMPRPGSTVQLTVGASL